MRVTAKNVAKFLRETPGLDKTQVGEFLSKDKDLNQKTLMEYVNTFNFEGLTIDQALRVFLESFMLRGKNYKIKNYFYVFFIAAGKKFFYGASKSKKCLKNGSLFSQRIYCCFPPKTIKILIC